MYIDDVGYKYWYHPGDRVIVRGDLVIDQEYGNIYLDPEGDRITSNWYQEKRDLCFDKCDGVVTIEDCYDGYYVIEEDFYHDWYFVDGMFVGLAEERELKDIPASDLDKILL